MHLLFLSHGKRGHAALAASITQRLKPEWSSLAAELGGMQTWYTPAEQHVVAWAEANRWPRPVTSVPRADAVMMQNADHIFYMEPTDLEILNRLMVTESKMKCLAQYVGLPAVPWTVDVSPGQRDEACELIAKAVAAMIATFGLVLAQEDRLNAFRSEK